MQSSSENTNRAMLLSEDNKAFKIAYHIEVSKKDSSAVMALYQDYLAHLHEDPQYSSLSAAQKKQFDAKYTVEKFTDDEKFRKSPYGKLNLFSQSNNKKSTIFVLKFKTEADAKLFMDTLQQKGIHCKIVNAAETKPALRNR